MNFDNYQTKPGVVLIYTGQGKGKTSASLGLVARGLGAGFKVAFIQFIKHWTVNEHLFLEKIAPVFGDQLTVIKGGKGFYKAKEMSAKGVSEAQHRQAAQKTYDQALKIVGGDYRLVVCDEIINALNDGLLNKKQINDLLQARRPETSLCLTGRDCPSTLFKKADIVTDMSKIKHHFDDQFLANPGIDY